VVEATGGAGGGDSAGGDWAEYFLLLR
jgi:hypothetical protein